MVALLAHGGALFHEDVGRGENRHGVVVAERLQELELVEARHVALRQIDHGIDHARLGARLLAEGGDGVAEPLAQLGQLSRRKRDADCGGVPAELRAEILARGADQVEQVDVVVGAARTARLVALDGEDDGGALVLARDARRDDALHALVPSLAPDDDDRLVVELGLKRLLDSLGELGLDLAPLVVDGLEARGEVLGLFELVAHEQVERNGRVPHASRGVQARDQRERELGGGDLLGEHVADGAQREQAHARMLVDLSDAVGDERAVLALQDHEVGDGAQSGDVRELAPQVRLPEPCTEQA